MRDLFEPPRISSVALAFVCASSAAACQLTAPEQRSFAERPLDGRAAHSDPGAPGSTGAEAPDSGPAGQGGSAGAGGDSGADLQPGSGELLDAGAAAGQPLGPPLERVHVLQSPHGAHVEQDAGRVVRFIAVGDTGTGDEHQLRVADAMRATCEAEGCDFVVLLGDNIYEGGAASVDDPQWTTKFEDVYAPLGVPFYPVLGNHDVGLFIGSGYNPNAVPIEVGYTERSQLWTMPGAHYTLSVGDVGFVMFDSTALYNHVVEQGDQHTWIDGARDALAAKHRWVFAAAHHTHVSNGEHGNAGAYAYLDLDPGLEIKQFVDDNLCGQLDMLFTGHDHNRQWLDASLCAGTEVVVSGAGAKTRALVGSNPVRYQSEALGFFYAVVDGDTLTGRFIDETGAVSFEHTLRRP